MRVSIWSVWRTCWGIRVWQRRVGITCGRYVQRCRMRSAWTPFWAEKAERPPEDGQNDVDDPFFTTPIFSMSDRGRDFCRFLQNPTHRGVGASLTS